MREILALLALLGSVTVLFYGDLRLAFGLLICCVALIGEEVFGKREGKHCDDHE